MFSLAPPPWQHGRDSLTVHRIVHRPHGSLPHRGVANLIPLFSEAARRGRAYPAAEPAFRSGTYLDRCDRHIPRVNHLRLVLERPRKRQCRFDRPMDAEIDQVVIIALSASGIHIPFPRSIHRFEADGRPVLDTLAEKAIRAGLSPCSTPPLDHQRMSFGCTYVSPWPT